MAFTQTINISLSNAKESKEKEKIEKIEEDKFNREECIRYLGKTLTNISAENGILLGNFLGFIPLALFHAVAYIKQTHCTVNKYIQHYKKEEKFLFKNTETRTSDDVDDLPCQQAILVSWKILASHIQKIFPEAVRCLMLCGYLHSDDIRKDLLQRILKVSVVKFDNLLLILKDFSLITVTESHVALHCSVQKIIQWLDRKGVSPDKKMDVWSTRLKPLSEALVEIYPFQQKTPAAFQEAKSLKSHIEIVSEHLKPFVKPIKDTDSGPGAAEAKLYDALGDWFKNVIIDPKKAAAYFEKALKIRLVIYGEDYQYPAVFYIRLGEAYDKAGDPQKAINYYGMALNKTEEVSRETQMVVTTRLGKLFEQLRDNQNAFLCYYSAYNIALEMGKKNDETFAIICSNLGSTYYSAKNYPQAIRYYQKALTIMKDETSKPILAIIYKALGKAHLALKMREEALFYLKETLTVYSDLNEKPLELANIKADIEIATRLEPPISQATHAATKFGKNAKQQVTHSELANNTMAQNVTPGV